LKAQKTYLRGKSVFKISILVIVITFITVYLTGENYNRTVTANLYLSLSIIGTALFLFMTYGLYKGIGLEDDFPKFKKFKSEPIVSSEASLPDFPSVEVGDGIGGLILSMLLWIGMTILFVVLLFVLEAVFWISIFIILAMLYWVFFRAFRLVFSKSKETKDNLGISTIYSMAYTLLYLGWIFGIVYLTDVFRNVS